MIINSSLTWFKYRDSEPPDDFGEQDTVGEKETVDDDLDEDDNKKEDNSPASFRIIMLKNAGNSPLSIHWTISYHTVICILEK